MQFECRLPRKLAQLRSYQIHVALPEQWEYTAILSWKMLHVNLCPAVLLASTPEVECKRGAPPSANTDGKESSQWG